MSDAVLKGKKIVVLVDHKFIPDEIDAYRKDFAASGAEVHFASRLWYGDHRPATTVFYSDVDPIDGDPLAPPQSLEVSHEVTQLRLEDYAAVLMSANYTSVRLRYFDLPEQAAHPRILAQSPPAVQFYARAMCQPRIVKGALCHGHWIMTPHPELLAGRKVICHTVVMADVLNCEAQITVNAEKVVVDNDLVTGFSKNEVHAYIQAIVQQIQTLQG
jgi:protease I